jgi:hypothetical protein
VLPFWPMDPGWVKNQGPDLGSESGMNNPDHICESIETIFWVKILKLFDADPRSGMEKIRIRGKHPGSATLGIWIRLCEYRCGSLMCEKALVVYR